MSTRVQWTPQQTPSVSSLPLIRDSLSSKFMKRYNIWIRVLYDRNETFWGFDKSFTNFFFFLTHRLPAIHTASSTSVKNFIYLFISRTHSTNILDNYKHDI